MLAKKSFSLPKRGSAEIQVSRNLATLGVSQVGHRRRGSRYTRYDDTIGKVESLESR